jgi:hypothetical protein
MSQAIGASADKHITAAQKRRNMASKEKLIATEELNIAYSLQVR